MTQHKLYLNSPWFEYVKSGNKKYEGRRNLPKVNAINIGDILEVRHFTDTTQTPYNVSVEEIIHFPTFEDALISLPMTEVLPSPGSPYTIQEGIEIYKKYVSLPTQIKDGVVMIKIKMQQ